jgi:biotin carboxyl carrier protein
MARVNGSDPVLDGAHATSRKGASGVRIISAAGTGALSGIVVDDLGDGSITVDGLQEEARLELLGLPRARLTAKGTVHDVLILPVPDARRAAAGVQRVEVVIDGWRFELDVEPEARARLRERATRARGDRASGGPVEVRAIIPGRVVSVEVVEGDSVEAGQRVLVVEAMKMQNEIRAPRGGTIGRLAVGAGHTVELGDLLLVIE